MHPGALRALEFDRVVAAVRSFALTPPGRARLDNLRPETEAGVVREALAATSEAVRYLGDHGDIPLRAPDDLDRLLDELAVAGRALAPPRLVALADHLESIDATANAIRRRRGSLPRLAALADQMASFRAEAAEVKRSISGAGDVVDDASPALASIRERLRQKRARLRAAFDAYLRSRETVKYLQDQVVTERNGRFVLLVRAEHRDAIPGLVHGSSSSGATLYLEPLATVEVSNDLAALESEEAEELHRILLELTDRFRLREDEIAATESAAAALDALQAKARLARVMDAVEPAPSPDGRLELFGARHPLLIGAVVARYTDDVTRLPGSPVPVDLSLVPPATALLITGPNTGGKTVALKTAGLLALMAQSGLHIPALAGSRLPVFGSIFADIGDEQSIASSLSTFSWHVTNIAAMDRDLCLPALVLLDEIGAGTDPLEGGALGVAIVEHFRRRGALVVGTSHYEVLKSYASTTPGVAVAAFAFDPVGFRPTFTLVYGTSGRSLALEVASRLGLPATIIAAAREGVDAREARLTDHLARVDDDLRRLAVEREQVARERDAVAADRIRIDRHQAELAEREQQFKRRVNERIDERVREARKEIDAVVRALKRQETALGTASGGPRLSTGDRGSLRTQAEAAVAAIADRAREDAPAPAAPAFLDRPARPGDRVLVAPFGLDGTVVAMSGNRAEIDVRGKRMRAGLDALRVVGRATSTGRISVHVDLAPREPSTTDLNVVGCTVDVALERAGRFLDDTLVTDQRTVRLIHGHGTGQLRKALTGWLKAHPLVAAFHAAAPEQGGSGVTVVELKE